MKKTRIAIATIYLLWAAVAAALSSEAATTFAGAIVGIDQVQQTITFQTSTGQIWTIQVADSNILNQQIAKGDRVKIDVELSDGDLSQRITKVTKFRKDELFEPPPSLDGFGP
jgi:ABC-type glycerol-3-phosphate transport system substrate-binding protein